jgi:hypothetical protein
MDRRALDREVEAEHSGPEAAEIQEHPRGVDRQESVLDRRQTGDQLIPASVLT